jgi:hypothetical protein
MIDDRRKLELIDYIDKMSPSFEDTIYRRDLKQMRDRYIFKDINPSEYKKDRRFLKNLTEIWIKEKPSVSLCNKREKYDNENSKSLA